MVAAAPSGGESLHLLTELKFNFTPKKAELNIKTISGSQDQCSPIDVEVRSEELLAPALLHMP